MIHPATARTIAALETEQQIQTWQREALAVASGAAEVSISFGNGSRTINRDNAEWWLANLEEALRIKSAASGDAADVSREPFAAGISFANRYIE
jgi:hypothetical protein